MSQDPASLTLTDHEHSAEFLHDVLDGLRGRPKTLPCKYLYDERGSRLFDQICELDEYYPTRTELGIMHRRAAEMADLIGPDCALIEYGSGSSTKTRVLLDHLQSPAAYIPIDIARDHLMRSAARLSQRYPGLEVLPVCADFNRSFDLPEPSRYATHNVVYFPGSTIGNLHASEAEEFLRRLAGVTGPAGGLLIGVDLKKDPEVLLRAYDDAEGVTARFNLNLLCRINRELGGDFVLDNFRHEARYNVSLGRVEMHLESLQRQTVTLSGEQFEFDRGETIHTENSYKYALDEFRDLAEAADWTIRRTWTDPRGWFSVQYLETNE